MKKISIDELIGMVDSRYSLVTIVSKRARQIIDGSDVMVKTNTIKPVAIAIEEFYDGKYEAIYDYDQYKKSLEEANDSEEVTGEISAENDETLESKDESNN